MNAKTLTEICIKKHISSINQLRKMREQARETERTSTGLTRETARADIILYTARLKEKHENMRDLKQTYHLLTRQDNR